MGASDLALLERWQTGRDPEAFREIAARHSAMVYGVCKRVLGNTADAEEVAQDCFLKLAVASGTIKSSVGGWLHTLATRRSLDRKRGDVRRHRRENSFAMEHDMHTEIMWDDIQALIDEAIAELPPKLRDPIIHHFLENETHDAVAAKLGVSRSAVTRRIGKGIEAIRRSLRRRGVPVAAGALMAMLKANAIEAAPAGLSVAIGKLAVSGIAQLEAGGAGAALAADVSAATGLTVMSKLTLSGIALAALVVVGVGYTLLKTQPPRDLPDAGTPTPFARDTQEEEGTGAVAPGEEGDHPDHGRGLVRWAAKKYETVADAVGVEEIARQIATSGQTTEPRLPNEPKGPPIGVISGWVIDQENKPIADATVQARGDRAGGTATTSPEGLFTVEIFAQDSSESPPPDDGERLFFVAAECRGYLGASQRRVPLYETGLELVLTQRGEIRGYVVDADTGSPIEEFEARIWRHNDPVEGVMGTGHSWSRFSSPDGRFTLPTQYDTTDIQARAPGYGLKAKNLFVAQGEIVDDVVIALEPGADIRGTVLDAYTRQPIEGVRVSVPIGIIRQWWGIRDEQFDAVTAPDGRFHIAGKAANECVNILAWHAAYAPEFVLDYQVSFGREPTILLSKGGTLEGKVVKDGQPIPGLRIHAGLLFGQPRAPHLAPSDEQKLKFFALAYTDEEGNYTFSNMPDGRYFMRIIDADPNVPLISRYLGRYWVDLERDGTVHMANEILDYTIIQGIISGVDDYENVAVHLCDARYPSEPMYLTGEKHGSIGPDEYGNYRFGPVPAGNYVIRAIIPGDPPREIEHYCTVPAGVTLELPLAVE